MRTAASKRVLDSHGTALYLGAHVETVRRLARRGEIPSYKIGKDWRFRKDALDQWIRADGSKAGGAARKMNAGTLPADRPELDPETLIQSTADLIFVFDDQARFTYCHAPSESSLHCPSDLFLGKKHSEVMPPHLDRLFSRAFEQNKNGRAADYDYELAVNGKSEHWHVALSPILRNGRFQGSVAVVKNMTDNRQNRRSGDAPS